MKRNGKTKKCLVCSNTFYSSLSRIKEGRGKFCSRKCKCNFSKGLAPWNKGKTNTQKANSGSFKKGERRSPKTEFHSGQKPWNKGVKNHMSAEGKQNLIKSLQGRTPWNRGKKLPPSWNAGKKLPNSSGEKSSHWKGNEVKYRGLHNWVERGLGKPSKCEFCLKDGLSGKQIHWANKSHKYKRALSDWIRLCVPCHKKYDGQPSISSVV